VDSDKNKPPDPFLEVIDLATVREKLEKPTQLAVELAELAGGTVIAVRPGQIEVRLSAETGVTVTVKRVNIYRNAAKAYIMNGLKVPQSVLENMERWERENAGRK